MRRRYNTRPHPPVARPCVPCRRSAKRSCGQIICIGPFAGKLHDLADEIIEDAERIDIGTMVIDEASTACYCLLEIVSDRGSRDRVAFIADHPEIAATMHDLITFGPTYD